MRKHNIFFTYVIPSVLAFALSGVYAIVDGFFIGNSLGDAGLTAINIAYPIPAFIQAAGTGIGLAGAIRFTILQAQKNREEETWYFSGTLLLLAAACIFMTGFALLCSLPMLRLLGASGGILTMANEYIAVIALGAVFQVFGTGLVPFIRNLGGATFAMVSMAAGFLTNILLDYCFVWVLEWGMTGAAAATIIGQCITMLCAIGFLWKTKIDFRLPPVRNLPRIFGTILAVSLSPFGLTFSPNLTLILMNRFLSTYGGDRAVATYACIAYIISIVYLLLQGIGDGSQPLISRYYGENAVAHMWQTRSLAYHTGTFVTLASMAALFFARSFVGVMFGASPTVRHDVSSILPLFLIGLLFLSFVRITTAYCYATEQSRVSYCLVYAEPILLLLLGMVLGPKLGVAGIWASVPLAQGLTGILAIIAKRRVDSRTMPAK